MTPADDSYFIPDRIPPEQFERGVAALVDRAMAHLLEHGARCIGCSRPIEPTGECYFILGRPAPRYACGAPTCANRLWRLAQDVTAPMLQLRVPGSA